MMSEEYKLLGRVTTASVFKCTGKHWAEWVSLLDKAGARAWTHQEIVAYLKKRHKLGPWWQQGVTSGYEIAIGRRMEGQDSKGLYNVTATKSLSMSASKVWDFLMSKAGLSIWLKPLSPIQVKAGNQFETLDGFFGEVRTIQKGRSVRMTWQDPNWERKTVVQLFLVSKPKDKAILAFNHGQIRDVRTQALLRKRWKSVVAAIDEAKPKGSASSSSKHSR